MNRAVANHWSRPLAVCTGAGAVLIGVLVIVGCCVGNRFLIQVQPGFAPMQFNTALALILAGVGILNAVMWETRFVSLGTGLLCTALGGLTTAQYAGVGNFGIDEFFFSHYVLAHTAPPGRMGPNTALCCILAGLALLLICPPRTSQRKISAIGLLGALQIAISGVGFFGYVSNLGSAYSYDDANRMGIHTTIGFIGVGIGMLAYAWSVTVSRAWEVPRWFSALAGICSLTVTLCLWQSLAAQEQQQIDRLITTTAQQLGDELSLELRSLVLPMRRNAWQWPDKSSVDRDEWEANLRSQLKDLPPYVAGGSVDEDMNTRWTVAFNTDNIRLPDNLAAHPVIRLALGAAQRHKDVTLSVGLQLPGLENGVMVIAPTSTGDVPDGFVVGLLDMSPFEKIFDQTDEGFEYTVFDAKDRLLYSRGRTLPYLDAKWGRDVQLTLFGTDFRIHVSPAQSTLLAEQSLVTAWILLAGIVVSVLLTMTIYFAQTSVDQTEALTATNDKLTLEINVRRSAEHQLQEAHRDLQMRGLQLISMTETAKSVNSAESLEDAVRITSMHTRSIIGSHLAFVCCREGDDWGQAIRSLNLSEKYDAGTDYDMIPHAQGLYAYTCEQNEPTRLSDAELDRHPRWHGCDATADLPKMRGWLAAPLIAHDGSNLGLIQVSDKYQGEFTEEDEIVLIQLAQLASTAIEMQIARRNLELQAEELTRSNTELEQFAYVASHDLQEPLRKIIGFTDRLEEKYKDRFDPKANRYLHYINDGAGRMQQLIKDLLTLSRVGRLGREFEVADCRDVVAQAVDNLEAAISEHSGKVIFDELPVVMGDATQLTQLFQNLIGNAIKFHGDKPPVVNVSAEDIGTEWQINVRDNGIGIDPKFTDRIFVIFQRLHTRTEYPGTGIGLAICKKIVERHGGRIGVEVGSDGGSVFYFTIPKMDSPDENRKIQFSITAVP